MILKILGVFDVLSAVIIWISFFFKIIPEGIILTASFYLIIKGVLFLISRDALSIIDIITGILAVFSIYIYVFPQLIIASALYLLIKGIFSIIA